MSARDVLVIGGGHNGLVVANLLARAGRSVVLLEARPTFGGLLGVDEAFPDVQVPSGSGDLSLLRPEVIRELDLEKHGLETYQPEVSMFVPAIAGQPPLAVAQDPEATSASLENHSASDGAAWSGFLDAMGAQLAELEPFLRSIPDLQALGGIVQSPELMRCLTLSASELLNGFFDSDRIKGALGWRSILGGSFGPMASGTGLGLLYQLFGTTQQTFAPLVRCRGGVQKAIAAMHASARSAGVDCRTDAPVARIVVREGRARGVELVNGETLDCDQVVSAADPRSTLLGMVGPKELPPSIVRSLRSARYRGATARLDVLLSSVPVFEGQESDDVKFSRIVVSPDLETLERASDAAKYRQVSERPCFELMLHGVDGETLKDGEPCVASITAQYLPYGADSAERSGFVSRIFDTLEKVAPGLPALLVDHRLKVAEDWESDYGLNEGSVLHGEMTLGQMMTLRPIPGYARYASPVEALYLCSAGTHPGGGVTGLPAWNAAQEITRLTGEGS